MGDESVKVVTEIDVPTPGIHGMTSYNGHIWFCCAVTPRVFLIELPAKT